MPRTGKSARRGLSFWVKWISGILASLATIVAAGTSALAVHQTNRVNQLSVLIRQQQVVINQQHQQLQSAAGSTGSSAGGRSGSTGGAALTSGSYLSALQPTTDNSVVQDGAQVMSAKNYPNSITFYCESSQPDAAFDVAGHQTLTAVVGIPDNTQDATGLDETVTFADQAGSQLMKPISVALGKTVTVRLNIVGVTQLQMNCSGLNARTLQQDNGNLVTLGNAFISS
jgi:hypothetical protein